MAICEVLEENGLELEEAGADGELWEEDQELTEVATTDEVKSDEVFALQGTEELAATEEVAELGVDEICVGQGTQEETAIDEELDM